MNSDTTVFDGRETHLSSMMSLQEETMMQPAEDAMTAWTDETRLRNQEQVKGQLGNLEINESVPETQNTKTSKRVFYLLFQNHWKPSHTRSFCTF